MRLNNVMTVADGIRGDETGLDPKAPPLDPTRRLKEAMRVALQACPRKRSRVVSDMNDLARVEGLATSGRGGLVSESLLDQWVAPGSTHHLIPIRFLAVFCQATGSIEPMRALAGLVGCDVIGSGDRALLEWARLEIQRRRIEKAAQRKAEEVGL